MARAAMTDSVWTLSTGRGCVSGHLAHLSSLDLPVDRSVHDHGWATGLQPSERTLMSA